MKPRDVLARLPALRRATRGLNLPATWALGRRCGRQGGLLGYGRIQLDLHRDGVICPPTGRCRIGHPLAGVAPRDAVTVISVGRGGRLELDGVTIGRGAIVQVGENAFLAMGTGSYLNDGSRVIANLSVRIGRECAIAWGVTILDDDGHGFGPPPYSAPVVIEDRTWVGCNVTILRGVTIGAGSVVAAGAVVTRSCPPASLLAGVPARVIRGGVAWTDEARWLAARINPDASPAHF